VQTEKRIRPTESWSLPTCFNRTRAAPNSASFARNTAARYRRIASPVAFLCYASTRPRDRSPLSNEMTLVIRCVNSTMVCRWRLPRQRRHRRGATYCHSQHLNPSLLHKHPRGRPLRSNTRQSMQSEQPAASRPVENGRAGWFCARTSSQECHHTQPEMAEDHVGTKVVDDDIRKSRRREPLFVYGRCFEHDFPERVPPLFDPALMWPLPLLTPVAATVSETSKSHHACSAEADRTRLRIAEIKLELLFVITASEAIMSPLSCGGSSPPNAQHLKRGAAGAFWGLDRGCGPSLWIQT
jgi:hypothetical protein